MTDASFIQDEPGFRAAKDPLDLRPGRTPHRHGCATIRYMKRRRERVGIRELHQNLSVYLRRVVAGETIHLATALSVGEDLGCLISYDARLSRAATSSGMLVLSPGREG